MRDAEERSRQHARRLEALWRIINNPNLKDEELWHAMLAEAAAAIRPGQPYRGTLGRVQGEELVLEAIVEAPGFGDANIKQVRAWSGIAPRGDGGRHCLGIRRWNAI